MFFQTSMTLVIFSLGDWKIASSLDIKSAFWNLCLTEESSNVCAFYALGKTYYPRGMPMGCMQSSYFLHLVMHRVLGDFPDVHIYYNDILCSSTSIDDLLHEVFERLRSTGLKIAPEECKFFQTSLTYVQSPALATVLSVYLFSLLRIICFPLCCALVP